MSNVHESTYWVTSQYNRLPRWMAPVIPHLHDTTGCHTGLTTGWMFVYMILSVVKPVWQPVWQPCWTNSHCSFSRLSNRVVQPAVYTIQPFVKLVCKQTSNWLSNGFDNRLNVCIHDTTWLQSICQGVLNRRSTAAELGKVEFALVKEEISFK